MMRWSRRIALVLATLAGLLLLSGGGAFVYFHQSLPNYSGEVKLPGLSGPVDIIRDQHAIPHIFATTWNDAYRALGYVHAQDRLWQMEMNRRIAAGRVAEVVGEAALDVDKLFRTLGIRRVAEANLQALDVPTRAALSSYAAGINAFLAQRSGPLPPEFSVFGMTPDPWSPVDSVAWGKMMQWDLGGNWRSELLRLRLSQRLTPAQVAEFLPPYPGEPFQVLPNLQTAYEELTATAEKLAAVLPTAPEGAIGSNNWVVSGARTVSGKPLLANDPHLGLTAPGIWYFAHLSVNGENIIGATMPGAPFIAVGRNDRIAWGVTNTGPDVQDLFVEKLHSEQPQRYLAPDGWRSFSVRQETIRVRGKPDVPITVRTSRHGPVISDVVKPAGKATPAGHVLAMQWTALATDDLVMQGLQELRSARDWETFRAALRRFDAPQQNFVYADVDGNIGFIAPAKVPVRGRNNAFKGLAPVPGWLGQFDWQAEIPFDALPQSYNPSAGFAATANEKITPREYSHQISLDWAPPYRGDRIRELLVATPKHSPATFRLMQGDVRSIAARQLVPLLTRTAPRQPELQATHARIAAWDGTLAPDRAEPLIFAAWMRELTRLVYADELGAELFKDVWDVRAVFMINVLSSAPGADGTPQSRWCDDITTPATETCDQQIERALHLALADLRTRIGSDPQAWRWGDAHHALSDHRPLGQAPVVADWVNIRVPTGGDAYTVNAGANRIGNTALPFANRHAASLRAIFDLAQPDTVQLIHPTGQSGNPLSRHYADYSARWGQVEVLDVAMQREKVIAQALGTLRLIP